MEIGERIRTSSRIEGYDFSTSKITLQLKEKEFRKVSFLKCNFDPATSFLYTTFESCDFSHSKLSGNFTNVVFDDCDFSFSKFKGGLNEFGFQRCKFVNCSLKNIDWSRPYFKSVEFLSCNFDNAICNQGYFSGFKTYSSQPDQKFFDNGEIKSRYHDGDRAKSS